MSPAHNRFARSARAIARRHAAINRARIGIVRLRREGRLQLEDLDKVHGIGMELDGVVERNEEWEDLREELLKMHAGPSEAFPPIPPDLSRPGLSVWLLTNLGLTADEIGDVLFMTKRSVETQRYRMGRMKQH